VNSEEPLPGRIFVDLAGDLQVRWDVTDPAWRFDRGDVSLHIELPDIGPTIAPARLNDRRGAGQIMYANVGSTDAMCDRVIANFTNLPTIFPAGSGRWQASGAGWQLTLEGRNDHGTILGELRKSLFFAVTHVGELRRVDGSRFKASEGAEALEALKVALSFALARWIAPVAPVGIDVAGKQVWQQWAKWRCDPVSTNYLQWWGAHGDDLEHFIDRFLTAWFASEQEREVIRYLTILLIAAHHWGTTIEAKIMLVHSAFDYLSWVNYVLSGKRTRRQHTGEKNGLPEATWHLKELLRAAKIPMRRPANLVALRKYASKERVRGAPATVARLRNKLTHPKDAGEPYSIEGVLEESWFLVTEWAELMLLHRIGYRGKYVPRKDTSEWVNSVPVPWAM
jgi:hypothetical protein